MISGIRSGFLAVAAVLLLSSCAQFERAVVGKPQLVAQPLAPSAAKTVEELDTTTDAERDAAAVPGATGQLLGESVASLGDATRSGFWIETPLAKAEGPGRLVYPANGKSVEVTLMPSDGGSSRVSLAAMRLLDAPLAGLPKLEVYALP